MPKQKGKCYLWSPVGELSKLFFFWNGIFPLKGKQKLGIWRKGTRKEKSLNPDVLCATMPSKKVFWTYSCLLNFGRDLYIGLTLFLLFPLKKPQPTFCPFSLTQNFIWQNTQILYLFFWCCQEEAGSEGGGDYWELGTQEVFSGFLEQLLVCPWLGGEWVSIWPLCFSQLLGKARRLAWSCIFLFLSSLSYLVTPLIAGTS